MLAALLLLLLPLLALLPLGLLLRLLLLRLLKSGVRGTIDDATRGFGNTSDGGVFCGPRLFASVAPLLARLAVVLVFFLVGLLAAFGGRRVFGHGHGHGYGYGHGYDYGHGHGHGYGYGHGYGCGHGHGHG